MAHEVYGRVDHVHGDVDAGRVLGLDAVARSLQKVLYTRTSFASRLPAAIGRGLAKAKQIPTRVVVTIITILELYITIAEY